MATPLARRLAGEAGIDLTNLKGSGPHGRIVARDVETAKAPALAPAQASAHIVLTADVALAQSLALCADVPAIELADVIVKAWATALARVTPPEQSAIALAIGKDRSIVRGAESKSLTAIAAARRDPEAAGDMQGASTAISIPGVAGITSIADVLQPPQTTILSIGAPRRAPIEAADGSVKFVDMMTATLTCDARTVDATLGAELLSAFKGFVERPGDDDRLARILISSRALNEPGGRHDQEMHHLRRRDVRDGVGVELRRARAPAGTGLRRHAGHARADRSAEDHLLAHPGAGDLRRGLRVGLLSGQGRQALARRRASASASRSRA